MASPCGRAPTTAATTRARSTCPAATATTPPPSPSRSPSWASRCPPISLVRSLGSRRSPPRPQNTRTFKLQEGNCTRLPSQETLTWARRRALRCGRHRPQHWPADQPLVSGVRLAPLLRARNEGALASRRGDVGVLRAEGETWRVRAAGGVRLLANAVERGCVSTQLHIHTFVHTLYTHTHTITQRDGRRYASTAQSSSSSSAASSAALGAIASAEIRQSLAVCVC